MTLVSFLVPTLTSPLLAQLDTTIKFLHPTFPTLFFYVHTTLEIHTASDHLHDTLDQLGSLFPACSLIAGMRGLLHYHLREFEDALALFGRLRVEEPQRVDDVDIYSNILYVSEKHAELALLAHEYIQVDRHRPEVCCLVGNYFSLRQEHEKAIVYFRRALRLDSGYLSAWTLMGHEYVEIKNTNAAIASYRRAVGQSSPRSLVSRVRSADNHSPLRRREPQGLPCLVRYGPDLRAHRRALLCHHLLPKGRRLAP